MQTCTEDWRTCGHCRCSSYDPAMLYPACDKRGFWARLLGLDMCPNAPMPEDYHPEQKEKPVKANIKLDEKDVITIQFTLRQAIQACPNEGFKQQTKDVLDRFEQAMEAAGFKGAKEHKFTKQGE